MQCLPVLAGHFVKQPRVKDKKPSGLRRAIGTCATFMVSGLVHGEEKSVSN